MNTMDIPSTPRPIAANELSSLLERFKQDGYVVLENCVPQELVNDLRKEFLELMQAKVVRTGIKPVQVVDGRNSGNDRVKIDFDPQGGNHDLNRWNMHLPSSPLFLREEVIAHPLVMSIIEKLIGPDPVLFIIASDTPYPGSGYQAIHQDFPRFGLTINIPLVDFTEQNAPLEVWPGTHVRGTGAPGAPVFHTGYINLTADEINAIHQKTPGRRMLLKAGSILIRDQRLVHRGTANLTDQSRPCLSLWYKGNAGKMRPLELNIPIPHRAVADTTAKIAFRMREAGRKHPSNRQNKSLVNLGSLLGRLVEEFSASDRDYRRVIPAADFNALAPQSRRLLRYARTSHAPGQPDKPRANHTVPGSVILLLVAGVFSFLGFCAYLLGSKGGNGKLADPGHPITEVGKKNV